MSDKRITRRNAVFGGALVAGAALTGAGFLGGIAMGRAEPRRDDQAEPGGNSLAGRGADAAWAALVAGNRRWASGAARHPHQSPQRRREVSAAQAPFAVVLSCVDSRVPPEVVFDAGVGDLLVVRTAAHTLDPLVTAAVEYGPQELKAPLVVVLGHQRCGAVTAAAHALREHATLPGELPRIVSALRPAYARARGDVEAMIRENVLGVVAALRRDPLMTRVVGARYDLDSGLVERLV
ncbi:carbonic anhydrase [Nonomuraea sp. NPDC050556]|uniref:carbonic anhydrase n=1 Tax=Nonomuraea sp. NPDC050556 TaxID=3364369 RepID=UPI0037B4971A